MVKTKTDPGAVARSVQDEPMQLREWGTDHVFPLPPPRTDEFVIGSGSEAWLQLQDAHQFVSRRHAVLRLKDDQWMIADARSKNGLWIDGERIVAAPILAGAEILVGRRHLVVESPRLVLRRSLLLRLLGWTAEQAPMVDRGLRALRAYGSRQSPLWLTGKDDLIAIARRIHAEVVGADHAFVIAHLSDDEASLAEAVEAARGGTLCLATVRVPRDLRAIRALASEREPRSRVVVCAVAGLHPTSIDIPAIAIRERELERIVDEYAADALAVLGAKPASFTSGDRAWLLDRRLETLGEIEQATLRMVAIREHGGVTHAAPELGVTHSALSRWLARRLVRRARPRTRRS